MKKIAEKIKKLLALANSSNQHEAETASRMANTLLVKHNLTMQGVEASTADYERDTLPGGGRATVEEKFILPLLTAHFFVKIVKSRRTGATVHHILGRSENVEVAKYVFDFLNSSFRQLWLNYKQATNCGTASKQSFYLGLYGGLNTQLSNARKNVESETGLVVVEDDPALARFMQAAFNNLKHEKRGKVKLRDREAQNAGHEAGKNLKIRRGLDSAGQNSGRLLG